MTCDADSPDRAAADGSPVAALPESYGRWRRSRLSRITDELEERLILDLLGPIDGLDVLDLGCGDGDLASQLAHLGARVTGLDADPRMLTAARRRADIESVELDLVRGDIAALPFPDASFDRIVAVTVLCFVRDADSAVAATWKAARFRTAGELRALLETHGLVVQGLRGSIYYPPCGTAASLLARFDPCIAKWTTFGAAFITVSAAKPAQ